MFSIPKKFSKALLVLFLIGAPNAIAAPYESTYSCLLYTSPSPRDLSTSRMPSSA